MPSRCLHVAAVQCWSTEGAMQVNRATFAEMCAKWSHGDDANVFFLLPERMTAARGMFGCTLGCKTIMLGGES